MKGVQDPAGLHSLYGRYGGDLASQKILNCACAIKRAASVNTRDRRCQDKRRMPAELRPRERAHLRKVAVMRHASAPAADESATRGLSLPGINAH